MILVIGGILHSGGVASGRVCAYILWIRLVFLKVDKREGGGGEQRWMIKFLNVNKGEG